MATPEVDLELRINHSNWEIFLSHCLLHAITTSPHQTTQMHPAAEHKDVPIHRLSDKIQLFGSGKKKHARKGLRNKYQMRKQVYEMQCSLGLLALRQRWQSTCFWHCFGTPSPVSQTVPSFCLAKECNWIYIYTLNINIVHTYNKKFKLWNTNCSPN